jgi:Cof subfamily protein (haloacid dehalogenase superfamily)
MFISDIDGTLLNSQGEIPKENWDALKKLQQEKQIVVLATGRNLYSVQKSIPKEFPMDYLIFSTGLGIMHWPTKNLIFKTIMNENLVSNTANFLKSKGISFFLLNQLPDNHFCYEYEMKKAPDDFFRRKNNYADFILEKPIAMAYPAKISQLIAVVEENSNLEIFNDLHFVQKIRSTSPIDNKSVWIEIFEKGNSKGHATEWLCNYLSHPKNKTMSIGNDFNDTEMLDFTAISYCVDNAPAELKKKYSVVSSNNQGGVKEATELFIKFFIQ